MIINDLIKHYNHMLELGQTQPYGWTVDNVPYALVVGHDGALNHIATLGDTSKKTVRNDIVAPMAPVRSTNIAARFGCDTGEYLLADPHKSNETKALDKYRILRQLWHEVLDDVNEPIAKTALAFVDREPQWQTAQTLIGDDEWPKIAMYNMTLMIDSELLIANPIIKQAWSDYYEAKTNANNNDSMQSLASGQMVIPVLTHPKIKGVVGAQSSGATLISTNSDAACSYGHEKNANSPMSAYEANAYVAAVNTMLKDWTHVQHIDNTTVLAWADADTPAYTEIIEHDVFGNTTDTQQSDTEQIDKEATKQLSETMWQATKALAQGKSYDFNGVKLNPDQHCSMLGLDPQSARLSIAFYLRDTMGDFCANIDHHRQDMSIAGRMNNTPPAWLIVKQTVNADSNKVAAAPNMQADVINAILHGNLYPTALVRKVQERIRAEHDINAVKAAIIKAYYTRLARMRPNNPITTSQFREILTVSLNTESEYTPYVLGRMMAVYENIQKAANPKIKATIKDKYFAQAAATPASIYPIMGRIIEKRMKQLERNNPGAAVRLSKQLGEIASKLPDRYPIKLTLDEQGAFQLGYYQQKQADIEAAIQTKNAKAEN